MVEENKEEGRKIPLRSRREILKLGAGVLTGMVASSILGKQEERNATAEVLFKESALQFVNEGPFLNLPPTRAADTGGGEGERAFWVDPSNKDFKIAGTWSHGVWQTTNGRDWVKVMDEGNKVLTIDPTNVVQPGVARNFTPFPNFDVLGIFDYSVWKIDSNGKWSYIPERAPLWDYQTGIVLPDNSILVAGYGGVAKKSALGEFKKSEGLSEQGFFRALAYDSETGKLYAGGWGGFDSTKSQNSFTPPGTGLWVSDDNGESFYKQALSSQLKDTWGEVSVNSINATSYTDKLGNKHSLIFVGCEGAGPVKGRNANPDYPFFFAIVDDELYDFSLMNNKSLAQALGQDIVTPNHGIEFDAETGDLYVGSWAMHIARVNVQDILDHKTLIWQRLTHAPDGQQSVGSGHVRLSRDSEGGKFLVTGGQTYEASLNPFTPIKSAQV